MAHNELARRPLQPRYGRLPIPITIGLVLAIVIVVVLVVNWFFYGQPVKLLQQRVVLADIEDFPLFVRECRDNQSSSYEIVTLRNEPDGNYLLLRVQLLLKYIYEKRGTQVGQVILRADDFALVSGGHTSAAVLLRGGYEARGTDGRNELVMRALALHRGSDGTIEQAEAGSANREEEPTVGDVVRGVKQLQAAASVGSGHGSRGVLEWVRAPLEERSKIIQPPGLSDFVWCAELSQNMQEAWRAAEAVCLFPLPPGTDAKLVVFGDNTTAIPITLR